MKKILSILVLFLVVLAMLTTTVKAMTADELADKLYEMAKPYGATASDKARLKNDLAATEITDEKANAIIEKAEKIVGVLEAQGVNDFTKLSSDKKEEIKDLAKEAAAVLDYTIVFKATGKTPVIQILKGSKVVDEIPYDPTTDEILLADTGNNIDIVLVVSSIAVVALLAVIVAKKFTNA